MPDEGTSLSLLQWAGNQDQEAWRRLVTLYQPLIIFWCQRAGLGGADVHDAVQEIFMSCLWAMPTGTA